MGDEENPLPVLSEEEQESRTPSFSDDESGRQLLENAQNTSNSNISSATGLEIGRKETRVLLWMKCAFVCIMLIAAAILAPLVYRFCSDLDEQRFEDDYDHSAEGLMDSFHKHTLNTIWAGVEMSGRYTRMSKRTFGAGQQHFEFPYISLPGFEFGAFAPIRESKNAISAVTYSPLVENKTYWEYYQSVQILFESDYGVGSADMGWENRTYWDGIYKLDPQTGEPIAAEDDRDEPYSPIWQFFPEESRLRHKFFDGFSEPVRAAALRSMRNFKSIVFSSILDQRTEEIIGEPLAMVSPRSLAMVPVLDASRSIVGSVAVESDWLHFFDASKHHCKETVTAVLDNGKCGDILTFQVSPDSIELIGEGDFHDKSYDNFERASSSQLNGELFQYFREGDEMPEEYRDLFVDGLDSLSTQASSDESCIYTMRLYPTADYKASFQTSSPAWVASGVVLIVLFTIIVLMVYDYCVERRQSVVMDNAVKSRAIVDSLFPPNVRDRLFHQASEARQVATPVHHEHDDNDHRLLNKLSPKLHLTAMMKNESSQLKSESSHKGSVPLEDSAPIAEVFLSTTIMFADIAGFTAWSSEREPSQVFILLETLYAAFDHIANELGVFKVETIGDCYMCVTGLPDPAVDHAVIMARFASQCLKVMHELTRELEVQLGPGTSDLNLRIGLHSGPVTAGVLRGEKSRFQLFGDSVNTAARMESNGDACRIHVSQATADLIKSNGKSHWVQMRPDLIHAKGKGLLQTYWVKPGPQTFVDSQEEIPCGSDEEECQVMEIETLPTRIARRGSISSLEWKNLAPVVENVDTRLSNKRERLIEWNTDVLFNLLEKLHQANYAAKSKRSSRRLQTDSCTVSTSYSTVPSSAASVSPSMAPSSLPPIDDSGPSQEPEFFCLPDFDLAGMECDPLGPHVRAQLRRYVAGIASMYHANEFHDFEHASHVALSASKLMKRIIAPEDVDQSQGKNKSELDLELHYSTFGISSDPLTQFCVVLGALVHDVDHKGVPNEILMSEDIEFCRKYGHKSMAEQHSVHVALEILEEDGLDDLRDCIYTSDEQYMRFHQLLVNIVLATDIADRELQRLRKERWDKAFNTKYQEETKEEIDIESPLEKSFMTSADMDRKATIVIEYIIQASDVAHTMQHWHVFTKWNGKLFYERYSAFLEGRSNKNPAEDWYESEISFFDNYIIPLAKKLKECGVFGISSDEYLTYAVENREEWIAKGEWIVAKMLENAHRRWEARRQIQNYEEFQIR